MEQVTPTLRERAYFLRGQIKANQDRAANLGATIDSLTAAKDAAHAQIERDEAELRTLAETHYAALDAEAKDQAQGRAEDFRRDGDAA